MENNELKEEVLDNQLYDFEILNKDGNKFKIKLENINDNMNISLHNISDITETEYKAEFNLDNLKEIHRSFKIYENVNEAIEYIFEMFQENLFEIKLNENNNFIEFTAHVGVKKIEKFKLNLLKYAVGIEQTLSLTCNKVEELEKEIKLTNKKIDRIEKLLNSYKEENDEKLKIMMQDIKKIKISLYGDPNFNLGNLFFDNEEIKFIKNAISNRIGKIPIASKKIFSTKVNGDLITTFHGKCDHIKNTLIVIKISNGRRFGGFTNQTWDNSKDWKDDKYAFVYSLNSKKVYEYKHDNKAIYCENSYGVYFGNEGEIVIGDHCLTEKNSWTNIGKNTSYNYRGDKGALSGNMDYTYTSQKYTIDQYDVFEIKFE